VATRPSLRQSGPGPARCRRVRLSSAHQPAHHPRQRPDAADDLASRRVRDDDLIEFADAWAGAAEAGLAAAARAPRFLDLRYERLLADQPRYVTELLTFIGADADPARVAACIDAASFRSLSGGRAPGQEDNRSFFRKASPGDWVNWLTPRQVAMIQSGPRADLMVRLGYTLA
jgi:hypothetical protein